MMNFAAEWKKYVNFKQLEYNEFISKFQKVPDSYFIEKIDGMLGALIFVKGYTYFVTINNIKIIDLPVLEEYSDILSRNRTIKEIVLIGELVAVRNNLILPFPDLMSVVKMSRLVENKPLVQHYIYDIFSINSKRFTSYKESIEEITSHFRNTKRIHIPKYVYGGVDDFKDLYAKAIRKKGIEGVVARLDDGRDNYKIKTTTSWDMIVYGIGSTKMKSWPRKQISYLKLAFIGPDGTFRSSSDVGTGFTHAKRSELYDYFVGGKKIISDEINGEFFVKPEMVVEIKAFRWRIKQAPAYKFTRSKYVSLGSKLTISLDMPSFVRERPDKSVNDVDIRLDQLGTGAEIR